MSSADKLAEAVRAVERALPLRSDVPHELASALEALSTALAAYDASKPSEATHERVRLAVTRSPVTDTAWGEPVGTCGVSGWPKVAYVTFWLPRQPPTPEVEGEVE